jgi:hypothetical protein
MNPEEEEMRKRGGNNLMMLVGSLAYAFCPVLFGFWQKSLLAGLFMFCVVVIFGWTISIVMERR